MEDGIGVPVTVSDNVERILGYPRAPRCLTPAGGGAVHPDDRAAAALAVETAVRAGQASHEYRFAHRDGCYLWLRDEMRAKPADDGGRPASSAC